MSIHHRIVEKRRLLGDRRLQQEIVEIDRRVTERRELIEEFQRRWLKENRRKEKLPVEEERRVSDRRND